MLLRRMLSACPPWMTRTSSRPQMRFTTTSIVWEDIQPELLEESPVLPAKAKRFYVPPPCTDEALVAMDVSRIREWPRGRVVWALGRLGFMQRKLNCETEAGTVHAALLERADVLELNTRDLVRVMQALGYSSNVPDLSILSRIRKKFCTQIANVNELYLISGIYGHFKLINRLGWKVTSNCVKTSEFLLAQLIERKNKIHSADFLEITSVILLDKTTHVNHGQHIEEIVNHAIGHSLKHVTKVEPISKFSRALVSYENRQSKYTEMNEQIAQRFSKRRQHEFGFWLLLGNLMSVANIVEWQTIAPKTALIQEILIQRGIDALVQKPIDDFTLHECAIEPPHVSRVIRRMAEATLRHGYFEAVCVGPFQLGVVNQERKLVLQWDNIVDLFPPHKRDVAKSIEAIKREYLERTGWKLVLLEIEAFRLTSDFSENNEKFKAIMEKIETGIIHTKLSVCEHKIANTPVSAAMRDVSDPIEDIPTTVRERRESKRKESRLKSTLRSIGKEWRKKHYKDKHN